MDWPVAVDSEATDEPAPAESPEPRARNPLSQDLRVLRDPNVARLVLSRLISDLDRMILKVERDKSAAHLTIR